ncbi:MAG: helix-turn-helix domain-containing protein [Burkholderiaceae bacterium]|nr:helix-turn-helix domain-containing protein [Burkholderiaceae bacterium]
MQDVKKTVRTRGASPLSRYVQILEAVAAARSGLTLTEISQQLDLRTPTVHRLVGSLKSLDLLTNNDGSGSYALGHRMLLLLHATLSLADYSHLTTSILRDPGRRTRRDGSSGAVERHDRRIGTDGSTGGIESVLRAAGA